MQRFNEDLVAEPVKDALLKDLTREEMERPFEYSATVLCKSPRQVQLEKRHKNEIERPSLSNVWYSFAGTAMHEYLENSLKSNPKYLVEKRIIRFDKPSPDAPESQYRRVGAKFDCYNKETKTLSDHKTTTTYIYGKEMKPEWIKQLMINAYFLEKEGYPVERAAINAIYMDWRDSKMKYAKDGEYPPAPSTEFSMKAWSMEDREYLYKDLLRQHIEAESIPDDELPFCQRDYCWESPASFAIYREGGARAIKLCASLEEAHAYIKLKGITGPGIRIEERKPLRRRCAEYCSAAPFCNQYRQYCAKNAITTTNFSPEDDAESSGVDCQELDS